MKSRRIKGIDKDIISHGICPKCAENLRKSMDPAKMDPGICPKCAENLRKSMDPAKMDPAKTLNHQS